MATPSPSATLWSMPVYMKLIMVLSSEMAKIVINFMYELAPHP